MTHQWSDWMESDQINLESLLIVSDEIKHWEINFYFDKHIFANINQINNRGSIWSVLFLNWFKELILTISHHSRLISTGNLKCVLTWKLRLLYRCMIWIHQWVISAARENHYKSSPDLKAYHSARVRVTVGNQVPLFTKRAKTVLCKFPMAEK